MEVLATLECVGKDSPVVGESESLALNASSSRPCKRLLPRGKDRSPGEVYALCRPHIRSGTQLAEGAEDGLDGEHTTLELLLRVDRTGP